jgi:aconitate hydratase
MPHWTNFPRVTRFVFRDVDPDYSDRARQAQEDSLLHAIVGGANYGQGSSRENAALIPRIMGLGVVLAKSIARIHWQNLVNFGVLPLTFSDPADADALQVGEMIVIPDYTASLRSGRDLSATVEPSGRTIRLTHSLSPRQIALIEQGGAINAFRSRSADQEDATVETTA